MANHSELLPSLLPPYMIQWVLIFSLHFTLLAEGSVKMSPCCQQKHQDLLFFFFFFWEQMLLVPCTVCYLWYPALLLVLHIIKRPWYPTLSNAPGNLHCLSSWAVLGTSLDEGHEHVIIVLLCWYILLITKCEFIRNFNKGLIVISSSKCTGIEYYFKIKC